ncbi:ATP-binding protein [Streptomyces sp. NPDC058674]|uniref:ATP-binding protein n=1 Tax=Streptomyces sp. NPDC058674 TaxID=3346592 RepID=UPI00364BD30A
MENEPTPSVPRTARQARDRVRSLIETAGIGSSDPGSGADVLTDALLVTSELATNAIRHGGGITGFSATVSADGLRLVIADASDAFPVVVDRQPGAAFPGGFGWPLIRRLARSVAVVPAPQGGKRIEVLLALGGAPWPAPVAEGR